MNSSNLATVLNGDAHDIDERPQRRARPLPSPAALCEALPLEAPLRQQVARHRAAIRAILDGDDPRLLVIVGPCSLHDPEAALEYGQRLSVLAEQLGERLLLVMRAYVEKPRTTVGWKGLLHDPRLDGSNDLGAGLRVSRDLLIQLAALGLPVATELLSPLAAPYLEDVLAWAAIGARTTESQTHREMVSGLAMPVGFKNGTDGAPGAALDAMRAAAHSHSVLGTDQQGHPALIETAGNPNTHLVLRGGRSGPNYDANSLRQACETLARTGLNPRLMVDCSHSNSGKDPHRQPDVLADLIAQRRAADRSPAGVMLAGVMLESHLHDGNQPLSDPLRYGVSITDACLGWEGTESVLRELAASI